MKSKANNTATTTTLESVGSRPVHWFRALGVLFKFRLNITVVFSSVMGYLITTPAIDWLVFILLIIGGFLTTGAANALNQVLERDYDILMQRTKDRPVAAGYMSVSTAVLTAGLSCLIGTFLLTYIHPLAGFLGIISLVLYAFVYTPLKRFGPSAVFVGAIPGALPVLIGAIAGSGQLTALGIILFGIQFFWQMPHFWAIAWLAHDDYTRAGFRLLPTRDNERTYMVGRHAVLQTLFVIPLLLLAWSSDYVTVGSMILLILLTLGYAALGHQLSIKLDRLSARKLMFGSFAYLPLVLLIIYIDNIVL